MANEVAWLIEAPGPFYLTVSELGGVARFSWTETHHRGLRFSRQRDAEYCLRAARTAQPDLFPSVFPRDPKPVEHAWHDLAAADEKAGDPRRFSGL